MTAPAINYRGNGAWGNGLGRDLQASEIDGNFFALAEGIVALQNNPAQPDSIASIAVAGTQMTITLTSGAQLGPFTLPTLMMRWRSEFQVGGTAYAQLDVFSVSQQGIYFVLQPFLSGSTFDPNIQVNGTPALQQLFGAVDASLAGLSDVKITSVLDKQVLRYSVADALWENSNLGSMADQNANAVAITGGAIANTGVTGLPAPTLPTDAVTKAYADALVLGAVTIPDGDVVGNASGTPGSAVATPLSTMLDHVLGSTARGSIMFRGSSGWIALAPGASGQLLKSGGGGADVSWTNPSFTGVTDIAAGTGISTGGSDITATGTISLSAISTGNILANISGGAAAPTPNTLSAVIDNVFGALRGSLLYRGVSGWAALSPGVSGKYLKTQGAGADPLWDSPAGAGTVTDIAAGTGISTGGADITSTGTISLATVSDGGILANISGSTAAPTASTMTLILDHVFGNAQGDILYRSGSAWSVLAPGTSGQVLQTGGAAANPSWVNAPTGSAITDKFLLANTSGGAATASGHSLSDILDYVLGSSRGSVVFRGASAWSVLGPGTSGQFLQTGGATADPAWASAGSGSAIANNLVLANISGSTAIASGHTLSDIIDSVAGSTRSAILFRGGSGWTTLAPGTAGQVLQTGTSGSDPSWTAAGAAGSLAGDSDVLITSPADHDLLSYVAGAGKWENKTLQSLVTAGALASMTITGANGGSSFAVSEAGTASHYFLDAVLISYGANTDNVSTLQLGRARGTSASPSAVQSGDVLGTIAGVGYGATAFFGGASIQFTATENWTDTSHGSKAQVAFVANGGSTPVLVDLITTGSNSLGAAVSTSGIADKDILVYDSGSGAWKNQRQKYIVSAFAPGTYTASQKILYHRLTKAMTFPANFGAYLGHTSEAGGSTNATGSTVFNIDKAPTATPNTFSNVGTITIAAAGVTPTFASSGGATVSFAQGDVLRIVAPSSADATFADLYASLVGFET
jgi:hypothetical protein